MLSINGIGVKKVLINNIPLHQLLVNNIAVFNDLCYFDWSVRCKAYFGTNRRYYWEAYLSVGYFGRLDNVSPSLNYVFIDNAQSNGQGTRHFYYPPVTETRVAQGIDGGGDVRTKLLFNYQEIFSWDFRDHSGEYDEIFSGRYWWYDN